MSKNPSINFLDPSPEADNFLNLTVSSFYKDISLMNIFNENPCLVTKGETDKNKQTNRNIT